MANDPKQLRLFPDHTTHADNMYSGRELGTFRDSLQAPIYRWFRYPAGYSYKFVSESFEVFNVKPGDWVYDPFSGTGTTLVCAKQHDINAYGVEAHSFVHWVASVKLYWEFKEADIHKAAGYLLGELREKLKRQTQYQLPSGVFPRLVHKCYHPKDLFELYTIREALNTWDEDEHLIDLFKLALTDTLRSAAVAQTGWPYIKPVENPSDYKAKNALTVFSQTVNQMINDVIPEAGQTRNAIQINALGDSRERTTLDDGSVKLAITSPPYLNNYDYADRTRLETYFWGITNTWDDITKQFRDKLLVAATTQIKRSEHNLETTLSQTIADASTEVYQNLQTAILALNGQRLQKGGKKSYDLMIALYFNGMIDVLIEAYRVIENDGHFCLVLGDSAPYGVHIPTDDYIGQLGLGIGFSKYEYYELRKRGGKWRDNPQRHSVPLREGVVILTK